MWVIHLLSYDTSCPSLECWFVKCAIPAPFSFFFIPVFSPTHSLNCWSSEAQGVSREFVQLWLGRVLSTLWSVAAYRHLSAKRLPSELGLQYHWEHGGEAGLPHELVTCTCYLTIWCSHNMWKILQVHVYIQTYIKNKKQVHTQTHICIKRSHNCFHKSRTQEDICKKDVVTFGYVGKEIIGMMEIWAQAYAHTHIYTLTFSLGIQRKNTL